MLPLLRGLLLLVITMALLSIVVAVFTAETGPVEKVVLVVMGAALVAAAPRVRRIGA